jgi:hypothetical protein
LAGLGAADDLSDRRDENRLTGTGAAITGIAITGIESDRRRADTVALASGFRISAEGLVVGLAADLVGAATVFFAADRMGAIVLFRVAWADIALAEVFAVGLCPCLSEPSFFSCAGSTALAFASAAGVAATAGFLSHAFARFLSRVG